MQHCHVLYAYYFQSAEDGSYESLAPNQSPINPPYKTACELKKGSHVSQAGTTTIMNSDPTPGDAATGTIAPITMN